MTEENMDLAEKSLKNFSENVLSIKMLVTKGPQFLSLLPFLLLSIFLFFLVVFFTLRDGDVFLKNFISLVPLKTEHRDEVSKETKEILDAVIFGSIFTAILQGILGGLGFFIFGLKAPVFWGVMIAILAFVTAQSK